MLAFHAERGDDPLVVFLSDGERAGGASERELAERRRSEASAALAELGVHRHEHFGLPDGELEESHELVVRVAGALARERAEIVYAPWLLECHADHRAASAAAVTAIAAMGDVRAMLYGVNAPVPANELYDVSRYRARKDAAIRRYASQLAPIDILRASRAMDASRTINIPDSTVTDCEGYTAVAADRLPEVAARLRALGDALAPAP